VPSYAAVEVALDVLQSREKESRRQADEFRQPPI
jgi:hypothetical protein